MLAFCNAASDDAGPTAALARPFLELLERPSFGIDVGAISCTAVGRVGARRNASLLEERRVTRDEIECLLKVKHGDQMSIAKTLPEMYKNFCYKEELREKFRRKSDNLGGFGIFDVFGTEKRNRANELQIQ